jgi:hypothetical protein
MDSSSHVHTLQYQYKFSHTISASIMSCLVSVVANGDYEIADPVFSVPVVVWQTGVIRLSGPVTIGLQLMTSGKFYFIDLILYQLAFPAVNCPFS